MINPNSKKQIVQLEEDGYFKDLIESVKTYLIEYPNLSILNQNGKIKKIEIYQTYLKCTDDEKIQIRKRGLNGD